MASMLRTRFGIPGVISVVALVFAMLGGAYAASNGGGGQTAEASKRHHKKKKSKAKRGPRGPRGKQGPAGPQGPQGAAGAQGSKGDKGDTGSSGSDGSDGVDAEGVPFGPTEEPAGEPCEELGGVEVTSASPEPSYVCNGGEGSPWTTSGTLPSGATETGTWAFAGEGADLIALHVNATFAAFTIPLATPVTSGNVHYVASGTTADCPGSPTEPTAEPGHFCVYQNALTEATYTSAPLRSKGGVTLSFKTTGAAATGNGSWAVTAP